MKFMIGLSVAMALSATCVISALAADPKPDAVVKTKSIDARVFLDDRIKTDTALTADCLTEGRKWLEKNAAEAAASRKEDPQFFKDGGWDFERKYAKAAIASLRAEKKKRDTSETATDEWFKSVEPSLLKIGAVTLAPSTEAGKSSGLTFHYPPYAVGPYAEGEYVAFVPWETLKTYLTAEGMRIFGGARPKGDAEEPQ